MELNFYNKQPVYRTGKFLKIEITSFYGGRGGLQFLSLNGKNAPARELFSVRGNKGN